ncbi:MAG TPA: outer membrane beta-barrel protein [Telluria sp.]
MKQTFLILALLGVMSTATAQSPMTAANPASGFVGLGVTVGGDELATATYTNGHSADIKAGSGVVFTAGLDYAIAPQFSIQGSVNFHVDNQTARNGDMRFQRFPVEVIGFYHPNSQWKVGGGVRYVNSAKLSGSGAAAMDDVTFKNTTSAIFETEYLFAPNLGVKVRYVKEELELKEWNAKVKANHVGISGVYYF